MSKFFIDASLGLKYFLRESNAIEGVFSEEALEDAHRAWNYLISLSALNFQEICKAHGILMMRQNLRIAGHIRKCNVWVGKRACPNPGEVRRLLMMWTFDYGMKIGIRKIKKAHVKFENIHPFEDGNGRIGRLILNWHYVKAGKPIMIIKADERHKYYEWFKGIN